MDKKKFCIGLTGRMASGKGEVVKILDSKGFKYISLSDIVRERAAEEGESPSRAKMQDIGNMLRKEGGAGVLGEKVREKIESSDITKWVIDGIRNPSEVDELRKIKEFFLVAVDTQPEIIVKRLKRRMRSTDIASDEELQKRLDREWGIGEPPDGQQVGKCVAVADFLLNNNSTIEDLERRTEKLLISLGVENG